MTTGLNRIVLITTCCSAGHPQYHHIRPLTVVTNSTNNDNNRRMNAVCLERGSVHHVAAVANIAWQARTKSLGVPLYIQPAFIHL